MLAVGAELEPLHPAPFEIPQLRAIAQILGDENPVHFDPEAARAAGLGPRPIVPGPTSIGCIARMLQYRIPGAQVQHLDLRFTHPVLAGDETAVGGTVTSCDEGAAGTTIDCTVWLALRDGARAAVGNARVWLPR